MNILIVDDHSVIREGLHAVLSESKTVKNIYSSSNGLEAIELIKHHSIDIVLMDIRMPEMDGIEATRRINEYDKNIKVIALTMHNEHYFLAEIMKAGAVGYLLKSTEREELLTALREVYKGDQFISSKIKKK